jgi:dipeptidyl aminopeptidase/acylaminoacyl peptidase
MEPDDDGLGDVSSAVQACVSYYGAHDFATWGGKPGKDTPEDLAAARKASTVNYVDKHDPPILVIHGNKDRTVPVAQSRKLAEALKQAGAPCEYWEVDGAGHGSCLNGKIAGDAERVRVFFGAHLKGAE